LNQAPVLFTGALTISSLVPGVKYAVLRYDSVSSVPTKDFLRANSHSYRYDIVAEGATYAMTDPQTFYSNSTIFYRCVKV
jgi:hypothetical protein